MREKSPGLFLVLLLFLALLGTACSGGFAHGASADLSAYPWVYLRNGEELRASERLVELAVVGDVMPGRRAAGEDKAFAGEDKAFAGEDEAFAGEGYPFAGAPWLRAADLALGNLECAIGPQSEALAFVHGTAVPERPLLLIAPPSAVGGLSRAGFDLLGLANNHALDRGLEGLAETGAALETAGILPVGAAADPAQAYGAVVRTVGDLKLAFLAFNAVPSPRGPEWTGEVRKDEPGSGWTVAGWSRERAIAAVESARAQADEVIVSIHWGYEYENRVDPAQQDIARDLAAAGASLITGHHPHVVQKIELIPGAGGTEEAMVAYSLGNFVFDQGFDETGKGLALRVFFDRQGLRAVQALPVHAGPRPVLMAPEEAARLLERVAPQPRRQAWRCDRQQCVISEAPASSTAGGFFTGESDLTGNGTPERVTLEAGRVRIERAGLPDWESPAEWQVLDLAAGDPNRDGRQELLLALQKPDPSGVLLSHPFILGHRGSEFRVLWGGSAVSEPILEVELGDLDGDGLEELAVLEDLQEEKGQAVSVWRWHGWGFSQVWRSAPGRFMNLRLIPVNEREEILLVVDETVIGGAH